MAHLLYGVDVELSDQIDYLWVCSLFSSALFVAVHVESYTSPMMCALCLAIKEPF